MSDPKEAGASGEISLEALEAVALEVKDWIWGTAKGAFNEKATASQIIVDAAIGMAPGLGDLTALRDLIAIVIGLAKDPRKREEKLQWMLLVIMLLALIPVLGGVFKGIGRLALKAMGEVAHLAAGAERAARLTEAAKDMVALLNHVGVGNAEKFLQKLNFAEHQEALLKYLDEWVRRLSEVLAKIKARVGAWVPDHFVEAIDRVQAGLQWLKDAAPQRLKDGIKEIDEFLREVQQYIRSGGETTSRTAAHLAEAGARQIHRTEELILLEGGAAKRTARGGWAKNSDRAEDLEKVYVHEPGFPDLRDKVNSLPNGDVIYPHVATYAGKIVSRELQPGERIFRVFGPEGATHGIDVGRSYASGPPGGNSFWGLNAVPETAWEWRRQSAVIDEWNHNGLIVIGTVLPGHSLPACTGVIAEQSGKTLASQFLQGGNKQAMLKLPKEVAETLSEAGLRAEKTGHEVLEIGGVRWELRTTGWSEVNGVHGYSPIPTIGSVQTERLPRSTLTK